MPFLTDEIYHETFGLGGQKYSWKKNKVFSENITRQNIIREKKAGIRSRDFFGLKIFLETRRIF